MGVPRDSWQFQPDSCHNTFFLKSKFDSFSSHRQDVLKLRHLNEKSSPEREARGRISLPNENRSPHHLSLDEKLIQERGRISLTNENRSPHHLPDEKLIQERKSFPTHSYLPEMESKSLDYIEPRTKRLSPPAKSINKPGPQVRRIMNILKKVHGKFSKSLNGISTEFCQVPLLLWSGNQRANFSIYCTDFFFNVFTDLEINFLLWFPNHSCWKNFLDK